MAMVKEFLSTVFIVHENKVLMTWNRKVRTWIPVGGHIEPNELPCDSAIREAKEESGLDIKLVNPGPQRESQNLVQPVHLPLDHIKDDHKHINLIYYGRVIGGDLLEESDEQTPLRWFTREEVEAEDLFPNVKEWALESLRFFNQ